LVIVSWAVVSIQILYLIWMGCNTGSIDFGVVVVIFGC
jgi:hypothetical protein